MEEEKVDKKDQTWFQNKLEYDKKYARENFQGKYITFNKKYPEDMALYEWMRIQPENGNQYIKRLIREDMIRRANETSENQDV